MGCKTVVVYSPQDLSCWWESNRYASGKGQLAFRLGANIIAYATGLEPPKTRDFDPKPVREEIDAPTNRGYLQTIQLIHDGDWQPAPRAMHNLMAELRGLGVDVLLKKKDLRPAALNPAADRFLYLHGRNAFHYGKDELKKLRFDLDTGGLLLADACCGSKTFDKSFRDFIAELWADKKDVKLERIPPTDELFGKELNDTAITKVRCRREGADGRPEAEFREVDPYLEGVKVNGRWAVIYSKYDIGCALEKHQSTDCLGHDHASAVRLATAAVLYALRR